MGAPMVPAKAMVSPAAILCGTVVVTVQTLEATALVATENVLLTLTAMNRVENPPAPTRTMALPAESATTNESVVCWGAALTVIDTSVGDVLETVTGATNAGAVRGANSP